MRPCGSSSNGRTTTHGTRQSPLSISSGASSWRSFRVTRSERAGRSHASTTHGGSARAGPRPRRLRQHDRYGEAGRGRDGDGRGRRGGARHQADAVRTARSGRNYVLTTDTGSGKSLAYIVPIVDHVLRHGGGRGIQALIVYPMNALANSQYQELEKFLRLGYPDGKGPVRFDKYTG